MDSASPLLGGSFHEPPSPTRPVSRASSTTTEVPGSPRSLAREVDHIKSLVSRAQAGPHHAEGSISAQIFRLRGAQPENITQAHIFHELDALKKRIRSQTRLHAQKLVPAQGADPETESESESADDETLDERDEELEVIREELALVRQQREEWIAAAEERIDGLISEKEGLADLLENNRNDLENTVNDKTRLEEVVRKAKRPLEKELPTLRQRFDEAPSEGELVAIAIQDLQRNLSESLIDLQKLRASHREEVDRLSHERDASQRKLDKSAVDLQELRASHGEEIDRLSHERDASHRKLDDSAVDLQKLRASHREEVDRLSRERDASHRKLDESAVDLQKLRISHGEEVDRLSHERDAVHRNLSESADALQKLRASHKEEVDRLSHERDMSHSRLGDSADALEKFRASHGEEVDRLSHERDALHRNLSESTDALEKLRASHQEKVDRLSHERDTSHSRLSESADALEKLRASHREEVDRLSHERDVSYRKAEEAQGKLKAKLADIAGRLAAEVKENRAFREQAQKAEQAHQHRVKDLEIHATELQGHLETLLQRGKEVESNVNASQSRLETTLAGKMAELDDLRRELVNLRANKDREIAELQSQQRGISDEHERATLKHSEAQRAHESSVADLKSAHAAQLLSLKETHAKSLYEVERHAEETVQQKDSEIAKMQDKTSELERQIADEKAAAIESDRSHESSSRTLQDRHAKLVDRLQSSMKKELEQAKVVAGEADEASRQDHEKAIADTSHAHDAAIGSLKDEHAGTLQRLTGAHKSELEKLQADAADAAEKARLAHDTGLREDLTAHEKALKDASDRHAKDLANLKTSHGFELERVQGVSKEIADRARGEHAAMAEELEKGHQDALNDHARRAEERLDEVLRQHAEETDRLRSDRELALSAAAEGAEGRLQSLMSDLEKRHTEQRENVHREHAQEIDRLRSDRELALGAAAEGAEGRLQSLMADVEKRHEAEQDKLKSQVEKLQKDSEAHLTALADLKDRHDKEKQELQSEQNTGLERLTSAHKVQLGEAEKAKDAAVNQEQTAHGKATSQLQQELDAARESLVGLQHKHEKLHSEIRSSHESELSSLRNQVSQALEASENSNMTFLQQLQALREQHQQQLQSTHEVWSSRSQQAAEEHQTSLQKALEDAEQAARRALEDAETRLRESLADSSRELGDNHSQELEVIKNGLSKELDGLRALLNSAQAELRTLQEETEGLRSSHKSEIEQKDSHFESTVRKVRSEHEAEMTGVQAELERIRGEHGLAVANRDETWALKVADLQHQHQKAITHARESSEKSAEDKLREVEEVHGAALRKAVEEARSEADKRAIDTESIQVDTGVSTPDGGGNEDVRDSLQKQIDSLSAELQEHEQGRRHLEELLQEKTHEAIQATEGKRHGERQLASLQQQMDKMRKEHEQTEHSLHDLQETIVEHQNLSSGEATKMERELAGLKRQIEEAKEAKLAAISSGVNSSGENSELARQNEFLTKQLAELGAMMSAPRTRTSPGLDKEVQTSPRATASTNSPRDSAHTRNFSLPVDGAIKGTSSDGVDQQGARSNSGGGHPIQEPKADISLMHSVKQLRHGRPVTPSTPDSKRRTFEDYLQQAQAELSELGSVITANEAMFAQKIQEHVGDLQKAKDLLANEYKEKFDDLMAEKERMDKEVTSDNAAEFVREREQLMATYGPSDERHETQRPVQETQALRSAEEKLVHEYNTRVAKRKSQIRLQHAEDFHSLTQDYDRRVSDLLFRRTALEGDLSVDASEFERDMDDIDRTSLELRRAGSVYSSPKPETPADPDRAEHLLEARDSVSRLPRRSFTSLPRTPTSIPRAVPYPGGRGGPQSTASPRGAGDRQAFPPAAHGSSARVASPPDGPIPRRTVAEPRSSEKWASPSSVAEGADQDFGVDPASFEMQGRSLKRQSASPNMRASGDAQHVAPMLSQRAEMRSGRSKRHSSGVIYDKSWGSDS